MPRSLRIEFPNALYHVVARGNQREPIFLDEVDCQGFVRALGDACERTGWKMHAWVLLDNHYHLLLQTPEPNLVAGMQWLQNTLTRRYNVRHHASGSVFGDRYKAIVIQGGSDYYFGTALDYIHLNPVRARLIQPGKGQSVADYLWSSIAGGYALPPSRRPAWLAASDGLAALGLSDTVAGRRQMVERLNRRAIEEQVDHCGVPILGPEVDGRCSHLRRGWYWGSQEFGEKLLQKAASLGKSKSRGPKAAAVKQTHGQRQAQEWLRQGLAHAGLKNAAELKKTKGSDPRKLALAYLLWRHTTVSQGWLAEQLHMRSAANVCQQLRRFDLKKHRSKLPPDLRTFIESVMDDAKTPAA